MGSARLSGYLITPVILVGFLFLPAAYARASILSSQVDSSARSEAHAGNYLVQQHVHSSADLLWNIKRIVLRFNPRNDDNLSVADCKGADVSFPFSGGPWNGTQRNINPNGNWNNVTVTADDTTKTCTFTSTNQTSPIAILSAGSEYDMVLGSGSWTGERMQIYGSPAASSTNNFGYFAYPWNGTVYPDASLGNAFFLLCDDVTCEPPTPPEATTTPSGPSSVLFLPGIEGSRLYRTTAEGEDKLWEPSFFSDDVAEMYLNPDGSSVNGDVYAKEGDIIESIPTKGDVYGSLETDLDAITGDGENQIREWKAAAYDWRLSIDDILTRGHKAGERIYYAGDLGATSTPYIIAELHRLAASSKSGKVTILAHSNGGLVAKRMMQMLGPEETARLIDKVILVASPQAGTPQAIASAMHGDDQDLVFGLLMGKNQARTFASTSPMTYNLMPSSDYFTYVDDPVVEFDSELTEWQSRYGDVIHSQDRLDSFLADSYGRVDAIAGDIDQPIELSEGLLSQAHTLHSSIDNWTPPSGVEVIQIAGWGIPSTLSGVKYIKQDSGVEPTLVTSIDGDGTVVAPSALWVPQANAESYWFDINSYNRDRWLGAGTFVAPRKHGTIFDSLSIRTFIKDVAIDNQQPTATYPYLSQTAPVSSSVQRLRYSLHSPLSLDIYDENGRHTGVSTTTGEIEEQVPNAYFAKLGTAKSIFTDTTLPVHLYLDGYATSTFTLMVEELAGDTVTARTTFKDIPVTPDTTATLSANSDLSMLSPLAIDLGDGLLREVVPVLNGETTLDITPPEIQLGFSTTTKGIQVLATDDSGSASLTSTTTYINATPRFKGVPVTTVTASDSSGNTTELVYKSGTLLRNTTGAILVSLSYNGEKKVLLNSVLTYNWSLSQSGSYQSFKSLITVGTSSTTSQYHPPSNTTVISTKSGRSSKPITTRVPGFVVPHLETKAGWISTVH